MNTKQLTKGFTIIEVVLVLAIAGLIFLMVFVALPALQSGQRDTARKDDVGTVATSVSNFVANNRGRFPDTAALREYATNISTNTDPAAMTVVARQAAIPIEQSQIKVVQGARCGDTGKANSDGVASQAVVEGTRNQFVVITYLEAGGGTSFCQET